MSIPKDKDLYENIKKNIYLIYPKHSAYRSGLIVKKYKQEYEKKYGANQKAYHGTKKTNEGLSRWFSEMWVNQRGETGYKQRGDVYRPTIRVNKYTPTTFSELTKKQIENAMKEKRTKGRVKKFAS